MKNEETADAPNGWNLRSLLFSSANSALEAVLSLSQ